jgi:hypothetical protein
LWIFWHRKKKKELSLVESMLAWRGLQRFRGYNQRKFTYNGNRFCVWLHLHSHNLWLETRDRSWHSGIESLLQHCEGEFPLVVGTHGTKLSNLQISSWTRTYLFAHLPGKSTGRESGKPQTHWNSPCQR